MNSPDIPTFNDTSDALSAFGALGNASEIHGLLTALLCASAKIRVDGWLASLMSQKIEAEDKAAQAARKTLKRLFEATESSLGDEDYSFHILVPDDAESFETRIEHFAYWCQGFISGLNLVGVELSGQPIPEVQEALEDLVKFSCLKYDEEEAGDEASEHAYSELVEYAKVAVMLIFTEKENITGTHFEVPGNETRH